eukprot:5758594-Alexandrium_andersonii.AAC.1
MEEDLQPRRGEVFTISGPALHGPSAFGSDDADEADTAGAKGPARYFIASDDEGEADYAAAKGSA